ncbi:MAG: DNA-binding protein [Nitrospiraceae bacterium]|nr:MAG: DNA-binding protein [Nitrospiraceae bacterium]
MWAIEFDIAQKGIIFSGIKRTEKNTDIVKDADNYMAKQIGNIKLYSVRDLCKSLGINERTIRDWFKKGRLKGVKIGTEWHITEDNLSKFFNEGEKLDSTTAKKDPRKAVSP